MRQEFERRRNAIVYRMRALPNVSCFSPSGAFYVMPNVTRYLDREFGGAPIRNTYGLSYYLLKEAHVAVVPGEAFGTGAHVRISFATSMERIEEGCRRIGQALARLEELLRGLRFLPERMRAAAAGRHLNATDVADYLAARGVPFRTAHAVAGRLVRHCLERGCAIEALSLEELRRFSPRFGRDVYEYLTLEACLARRASPGGTAPATVRRALRQAANRLKAE